MDSDVQEQLISTIMKTFDYSKDQADYLFIQLMNCVANKELVNVLFIYFFKLLIFVLFFFETEFTLN